MITYVRSLKFQSVDEACSTECVGIALTRLAFRGRLKLPAFFGRVTRQRFPRPKIAPVCHARRGGGGPHGVRGARRSYAGQVACPQTPGMGERFLRRTIPTPEARWHVTTQGMPRLNERGIAHAPLASQAIPPGSHLRAVRAVARGSQWRCFGEIFNLSIFLLTLRKC